MYVSVYDEDAESDTKRGNIHEVFHILKNYQNTPLSATVASDSGRTAAVQVSFSFSGKPSIDRSFSKMGR